MSTDFEKMLGEFSAFDKVARRILSATSPNELSKEDVEGIAYGEALPTRTASPYYRWSMWMTGPIRVKLQKLRGMIREAFFDLLIPKEEKVPELRAGKAVLREYLNLLQEIVDSAGPRRFTYKGFSVENSERLANSIVERVLGAIDAVVALFKRRHVEPLLRETVSAVRIFSVLEGRYDVASSSAAVYDSGNKTVVFAASGLLASPRMMTEWVPEILVHELGHHVHLDYLHPRAKAEWDSVWKVIQETKEKALASVTISANDRVRFFQFIEKNGWDPKKAGSKLKGLDKVKYLTWLYKSDNPLITVPTQVRLTEYGKDVFSFFRDPGPRRAEYMELNGPDRVDAFQERLTRVYKGNLRVGWPSSGPELDAEIVEEIRRSDTTVDAAIERLGIPTDYGRTNVMEDFAETFVQFMNAPTRLSDTARYRMERALSLSSLYGKPVMRVGGFASEGWTVRKEEAKAMNDNNKVAAPVRMTYVSNYDAKDAILILTIRREGDGAITILAKRNEVDPSMAPSWDAGRIAHRAKKLKALANLLRTVRLAPGKPSEARLGEWSRQQSWSDNYGYVFVTDDTELADQIAKFIPKVFPISGGGVPGSTGYRGAGWKSKGTDGEWVWEESSYGIGD